MQIPKLYCLPTNKSNSFLSIAEKSNIPFQVKRVFWITDIKKGEIKGEHAHKRSLQLLICISGKLKVTLESIKGKKSEFELNKPNQAVYIPAQYWGKIEYLESSIILGLASDEYDELDYIREYKTFKSQ